MRVPPKKQPPHLGSGSAIKVTFSAIIWPLSRPTLSTFVFVSGKNQRSKVKSRLETFSPQMLAARVRHLRPVGGLRRPKENLEKKSLAANAHRVGT